MNLEKLVKMQTQLHNYFGNRFFTRTDCKKTKIIGPKVTTQQIQKFHYWVLFLIVLPILHSCTQNSGDNLPLQSEEFNAFDQRIRILNNTSPDSALVLTDSLLYVLSKKEVSPHLMIDFYLLKIIVFRKLTKPEDELSTLYQARALAANFPDDPYLEAKVNLAFSNFYSFYYQNEFAIEYAQKANQYFSKNSHTKEYPKAKFELAEIYLGKKQYLQAIFTLQEVLNKENSQLDTATLVGALTDLGYNLNQLGQYNEGLNYTIQAMNLIKAYSNPEIFHHEISNLAINYKYLHPDSSIFYLEKSIAISESKSDSMTLTISKYNFANRLNELEQSTRAKKIYLEVMDYCKRNNVPMGITMATYGLGEVEAKKGNNRLAIAYHEKAKQLATSQNLDFMYEAAIKALQEDYRKTNNFMAARTYKIQLDSIQNLEVENKIKELQKFSQMARTAKEAVFQKQLLTLKSEELNRLAFLVNSIWTITGIFILVFSSILLNLIYTRKQRAQAVEILLQKSHNKNQDEKVAEPEHQSKSGDPLDEQFIQLLMQDKLYLNLNLKIEDVASMMGVSSRELGQLISTNYNTNFNTLVNHYRIKHAKVLLQQLEYSTTPLDIIAKKSGFGTRQSLHNNFIKHTGLSPNEYKRNFQTF